MIGNDIVALFQDLGDIGMLFAITLIIWIDGTAFPTVPEIWLVPMFIAHADSFGWMAVLVLVATLAGLAGNLALFGLVKVARLPRWIQKTMKKYTNFLVVKDERLLILNKFAPIVPYTGAFIAVCNWNLKKSVLYVFIGGLAKFSMIAVISWLSYDNLRRDIAPLVSLAIVAVLIGASVISSLMYRRRVRARGELARSQ